MGKPDTNTISELYDDTFAERQKIQDDENESLIKDMTNPELLREGLGNNLLNAIDLTEEFGPEVKDNSYKIDPVGKHLFGGWAYTPSWRVIMHLPLSAERTEVDKMVKQMSGLNDAVDFELTERPGYTTPTYGYTLESGALTVQLAELNTKNHPDLSLAEIGAKKHPGLIIALYDKNDDILKQKGRPGFERLVERLPEFKDAANQIFTQLDKLGAIKYFKPAPAQEA